MKKIEIIRAIITLNDLNVINNDYAFKYIKEILQKTITGRNKNYDKYKDEFYEDIGELKNV